MNLSDKNQIKSLCQKYGLHPRRQSGQNFLIDEKVLQKIVAAADLKPTDVVLEAGPGFGVLTQELAKRVKKVVAVEIDKGLVQTLRETLVGFDNVEVIAGDVLKLTNVGCPTSHINKVVANLPYNITARFLRRFIGDRTNRSDRTYMTLMLQKEVAERICARAGKMSLLAVSVQFFAKPTIVATVSKKSFWPEPEVDSAIIKIKPQPRYSEMLDRINKTDRSNRPDKIKEFFRVVKIGFSARRKQLQNNLAHLRSDGRRSFPLRQGYGGQVGGQAAGVKIGNKKIKRILREIGLDEKVRAQELGIEDWIRLVGRIRLIG